MGAQAGVGGLSGVKLLAGLVRKQAVSSLQLAFMAPVTARNGVSLLGLVCGADGARTHKAGLLSRELVF